MRKQTFKLLPLLAAAILATSCGKNDDPAAPVPTDVPTDVETQNFASLQFTITASKSADKSLSKSLALTKDENEEDVLSASWKKGDIVAVYKGKDKVGELKAQSDGESTILSGEVQVSGDESGENQGVAAGDELTLVFNETDYTGQDGTLETIAEKYDCAKATVTVDEVADGKITITDASAVFTNQQAIVKFTLSIGGDPFYAKTVTVNDYTITLSTASNVVYVAIPGCDAKAIHLSAATEGNSTYSLYKDNAGFENGKYYMVTVSKMNRSKVVDLSKIQENYLTLNNGDIVTGKQSKTRMKISIASEATVTFRNAEIDVDNTLFAAITCNGDATIILVGNNTVNQHQSYYAGIYVPQDRTLTIDGTGSLTVNGGQQAAGIGSEQQKKSCGNITINGGTVTAAGGYDAAGIGSGSEGTCGDITINGGTVTTSGGNNAAGIGSGSNGSCGNILITGGTVEAKTVNGRKAASIGCGYLGGCENITISGGKVTAISESGGDGYIGKGFNGKKVGKIMIDLSKADVTGIESSK